MVWIFPIIAFLLSQNLFLLLYICRTTFRYIQRSSTVYWSIWVRTHTTGSIFLWQAFLFLLGTLLLLLEVLFLCWPELRRFFLFLNLFSSVTSDEATERHVLVKFVKIRLFLSFVRQLTDFFLPLGLFRLFFGSICDGNRWHLLLLFISFLFCLRVLFINRRLSLALMPLFVATALLPIKVVGVMLLLLYFLIW